MKDKDFKKLLRECSKTVYLDLTRFQLDNDDFYLDANLNYQLPLCYQVYQGEEEVELTEKQELMLLKSMQDYTESQVDNSAFTNQDYDHFESLIHN
jgi:hypothetical protein